MLLAVEEHGLELRQEAPRSAPLHQDSYGGLSHGSVRIGEDRFDGADRSGGPKHAQRADGGQPDRRRPGLEPTDDRWDQLGKAESHRDCDRRLNSFGWTALEQCRQDSWLGAHQRLDSGLECPPHGRINGSAEMGEHQRKRRRLQLAQHLTDVFFRWTRHRIVEDAKQLLEDIGLGKTLFEREDAFLQPGVEFIGTRGDEPEFAHHVRDRAESA